MKPPRKVPTKEEVLAALPHIRYEIEALLLAPNYDVSNTALRESVFLRQMAHARVLVEFFRPEGEMA